MNVHFVHPDERIARLAAKQHGLVTRGQLRRLDLSDGAVRGRRESGHLRAVHAGVFAVGHDALTDSARMLAAVMACGPEALLSHTHAADVWDILPPWGRPGMSAIHVTVPATSGRGRRPGIVAHRTRLPGADRAAKLGIPITTSARTVLDLAGIVDTRSLERAIDQALTSELTSIDALHICAAAHRGSRGAGALRRILEASARFDSLTDSELEERFLKLVRSAGLNLPRLNARVAGMRVDATWPAEGVAIELDGYRWHRTRSRAEADRQREMRLRAAGWAVLRYSARQVFEEPLRVTADLASELREGRQLGSQDLNLDCTAPKAGVLPLDHSPRNRSRP